MSVFFGDTSALAKRYVTETGFGVADGDHQSENRQPRLYRAYYNCGNCIGNYAKGTRRTSFGERRANRDYRF